MKAFMDEDFLLSTGTAKRLYHGYAEPMPILDYHCHISPQDIYEDRQFDNITQVWLEGDHYKWRQMRSNGIEERYITGEAPDFEKFIKWAETLEMAIGNPLYHWSHLELCRFFGFQGHLNRRTAEEVWELCNQKLQKGLSAREMIRMSRVKLICTTDDPADSLEWHRKLAEDATMETRVLPTFRPEKAMNLCHPDYLSYLDRLGEAAGIRITTMDSLMQAIRLRIDFFHQIGCRISDHSLEYVMYAPADKQEIERIFAKRLEGGVPDKEERKKFETAFMLAAGEEYQQRDWAMQLHFSVRRDNNQRLYERLGPDAGIDCIDNQASAGQMAAFLNELDLRERLPKTILYSLNPADNAIIGTVIGCFQDSSAIGKLQQGSAWWFNDHKTGMTEQLISLANLGLLGNFIGMLTDSRSFLSYTRHEYFRRILCRVLGEWIEEGEYPADWPVLERIVRGICYTNAMRYFGFPEDER